MATIVIGHEFSGRYGNVVDMRGTSAETNAASINAACARGGDVTIFPESSASETIKFSSAISLPSNCTLRISAGLSLQPTAAITSACVVSSGTSHVKVTGDGSIICTAATVPSFTNVDGLEVSVRIETADGSPLPYAGTGNTVRPLSRDVVAPIEDALRLKQPRVLKQFNNLNDITFTDNVLSSARVIDQASPFGRPALKLTLTGAGSTGYCEVHWAKANIKEFNGHVAWRFWLDNYTRVSELRCFIGNSASYTLVNSYTHYVFDSNTGLFGGLRTIVSGPQAACTVNSSPTFEFGSSSLVATKVRIFCPANTNTIVWIDAIEIPEPQRPIVCLTFDDADVTLATQAAPIMEENGLRGTFGINTTDIDSGAAFLTSAQVTALSDAGHQVAAHNQTNAKLRTVYAAGIINGTGPIELDAYLAQYRAACGVLENLGVPARDFCYHPWVQGGFDGAAIEEFRAAGVRLARSIVDQTGSGASAYGGANVYGSGLGNLNMALNWRGLGSGITLANALLALEETVQHGSCWIPSGHILAATASSSVTWAIEDFRSLCEAIALYKASGQADVLLVRELVDRFGALGILDGNPLGYVPNASVRQIGHLANVNFNSTADQAITLANSAQSWEITDIIVTNVTVSLTAADGGIYTAASKGGTEIVAATQIYTALTGTATQILRLTIASAGPASTTLYFSLTGAQGSAATGDIFVFGKPV